MDTNKTVDSVALNLKGTFSGGINWSWYTFPTEDAATEFDTWCRNNGYETRGVYAPPCTKESAKTSGWGVRFR
jgi:hypothetical protein